MSASPNARPARQQGATMAHTAAPLSRDDSAAPLDAIAGFAAMLRDHGLKVGIAEQQAMVRAALAVPLARCAQLEGGWRAIACHDAKDWRRWPELFERYWHPERLKGSVRVSGQTRPRRDLRQTVAAMHSAMDAAARPPPRHGDPLPDTALEDLAESTGEDPGLARAQGGASRVDALHDRSLTQWLPQELALLQSLAERIAVRLRRRLTRRWHDNPQGRRLDLRRTLRASLRTGGVPVAPAWRKPRRERPRVFILVDVSRSMETHAQLFLRLSRAFVSALGARVFVFHTRLTEVTGLLQRDSLTVQEKINAVTAGFGGGTRIATSVADFIDVHARAQLGRSARVWILSDGFDADEPQALAREIERVRARGARITWFHPTAQAPASRAVQGCAELIERFVRLTCLRDLAQAATALH